MELYPFQVADIEKIVRQKAGLIGSEMGTGKTLEAIMLDQQWYKNSKKPTLVLAPLNTFNGWQRQYGLWAPDVDVITIDRKNRDLFAKAARLGRGDVFLMHWDALRLMPELTKVQWGTVIGDEVHRVANRKSQVFRATKRLRADHKLGMSGTATGDQPQNLWSIVNWLWPTYYTSYWTFRRHYCVEERPYVSDGAGGSEQAGYTKIVGVQNIPELMEEMSPWYVRHLKRERCCDEHPEGVMPWLQEKVYDTMWVELTPKQRRVYEQMKNEMVAWVNEHEDTPLVAGAVVAQLARLSQIALASPVVLDSGVVGLEEPSAKLDVVVELLKDNPNKKFVIASASKKFVYMIEDRLRRSNIGCFTLTGDTPQSHRDGMVERFQHDNNQAFIGVIEAMAEGIDGLQWATDTMIFTDRSWRTIKNMQCEDRLHRDGQKNAVQIIDIMARDTLDLGRKQKLETKWSWIKKILGDGFNNVQEAA
jgi:SWI/SNF-related matrix-associated actin-dependent regulator 1 of chromatin subfamily A